MRRWLLVTVACVACVACKSAPHDTPAAAKPGATELQAWVQGWAQDDSYPTPAMLLARLHLPEATWATTIVAPFGATRTASEQALQQAVTAWWPRIHAVPAPSIAVRRHFAGDDQLPPGSAHLRWIVPVLFESYVVALNGVTLDAVFWPVASAQGWQWHAIGNVDAALAAAVQHHVPAPAGTTCATHIVASQRNQRCLDLAVLAVTAALRNNAAAAEHACALVNVHCPER